MASSTLHTEFDLARSLMDEFAHSTGLTGDAEPRRYLWTDAFAVCNYLGLYRATNDDEFLQSALALVHQVHEVLGRHRKDDRRRGWISGLTKEEGLRHPTCAGLRIGKELNERRPDQPLDPRQEWDRDGQYYHYLTKWMHALYCACMQTGDHHYLTWAVELAIAANRAFIHETAPGRPKRMYWKMSIDLSRPLVPSMGHHDPLDGLITLLTLQQAREFPADTNSVLKQSVNDLTEMCRHTNWQTDDPLGIGGLLFDASRLGQLVVNHDVAHRKLLRQLLKDAELSLQAFAQSSPLAEPAEHRLAFRELGLSIGLHAIKVSRDVLLQAAGDTAAITQSIEQLFAAAPLATEIESFWSVPAHRQCRTWTDHGDINAVMLATSLMPLGFVKCR